MSVKDIEVPPVELVDLDDLRLDGDNPNKMKRKQLDALRRAIVKWGFIVPVVTNRDLMVADGEQRITVARELGMKKVPVVRLEVEDVDRRLLRQILNKLKGQHVPDLDKEEFFRIIELGGEEDLKEFLMLSERQLSKAIEEEKSIKIESQYEVVVECEGEFQQREIFDKLTKQGYKCRVLTL